MNEVNDMANDAAGIGDREHPSAARPFSPRSCCLIVLVVFFVLPMVVIGTIGLIWWRYSVGAKQRADEAIAKIEAVGEPVTLEQLDAFYVLPEGAVDVTDLWLKAGRMLENTALTPEEEETLPIIGDCREPIPPPGQPWPMLEAVEAFLARRSEALELLHQAADEPNAGTRFPWETSDGLWIDREYLTGTREATRTLQLQNHAAAHRGNAEDVVRAFQTTMRLSRSLQHDPALVTQLTRVGIVGAAAECLKEVVPHVELSAEQFTSLRAELQQNDHREPWRLAMIGERAWGLHLMTREPSRSNEFSVGGRLFLDDQAAWYADWFTRLIVSLEHSWPEALAEAAQLDDELQQLAERSTVRHQVVFTIAPSLGSALSVGARCDATQRTMLAMLAVEQYRRTHGAVPDTLDQLVPDLLDAVPVDPFDGLPLRYAYTPRDYVIYSIGRDGVDNGGNVDESDDGDAPTDVGVRIELPESTGEQLPAAATEK